MVCFHTKFISLPQDSNDHAPVFYENSLNAVIFPNQKLEDLNPILRLRAQVKRNAERERENKEKKKERLNDGKDNGQLCIATPPRVASASRLGQHIQILQVEVMDTGACCWAEDEEDVK